MEENEEKNLAQNMKKETKDINIYYEKVKLELSKIKLENITIEEKHKQKIDESNENKDIIEYGIFIKFKGENIKIAIINEDGVLAPNKDILNNEDKKYTDEELAALGDMLNRLGLENDKVNIENLKTQLKDLEAKTQEELEKKVEQKKENDSIKDKDEQNEKDEQEEEKDEEEEIQDIEKEGEEKVIAKKKGTKPSNICKIRRDSQFFRNYPNIPKTAYFYLDAKDRIHAEYIDENGQTKELSGFEEITDRPEVTRLGNDGQNIKDEVPYRVMTAEGLEDRNQNTQDIRIAMYKDQYGYLRVESIHQGRNGQWEGKNIDIKGTERNTEKMNNLIDEKNRTPHTGQLAKRQEELKRSGYSQDGLSLDEFSKNRKINEYMQDGYTFEEAKSIYNYVVGELELTENDAKVKVNEEREEKHSRQAGGRDQGEEAYERLMNRGH